MSIINTLKKINFCLRLILDTIKKFTLGKKKFLSIGAGIGGLELLILKYTTDAHVSFIEKNFENKYLPKVFLIFFNL